MLVPQGNSGNPLDENVHWDRGLLIDYDYAFLYAEATKKLKELSLRMAKEHQNNPAASLGIMSGAAQGINNPNELLLHHTVISTSKGPIINNRTTGNIPIHVHPTFDCGARKNTAF